MIMAKKVIRYLKDIMHLSLIYDSHLKDERETKVPITLSSFRLIGYGDSIQAKNPKDKKFVMGYDYFINRAVVS